LPPLADLERAALEDSKVQRLQEQVNRLEAQNAVLRTEKAGWERQLSGLAEKADRLEGEKFALEAKAKDMADLLRRAEHCLGVEAEMRGGDDLQYEPANRVTPLLNPIQEVLTCWERRS
jgi:chromosome segregation ATPase